MLAFIDCDRSRSVPRLSSSSARCVSRSSSGDVHGHRHPRDHRYPTRYARARSLSLSRFGRTIARLRAVASKYRPRPSHGPSAPSFGAPALCVRRAREDAPLRGEICRLVDWRDNAKQFDKNVCTTGIRRHSRSSTNLNDSRLAAANGLVVGPRKQFDGTARARSTAAARRNSAPAFFLVLTLSPLRKSLIVLNGGRLR